MNDGGVWLWCYTKSVVVLEFQPHDTKSIWALLVLVQWMAKSFVTYDQGPSREAFSRRDTSSSFFLSCPKNLIFFQQCFGTLVAFQQTIPDGVAPNLREKVLSNRNSKGWIQSYGKSNNKKSGKFRNTKGIFRNSKKSQHLGGGGSCFLHCSLPDQSNHPPIFALCLHFHSNLLPPP